MPSSTSRRLYFFVLAALAVAVACSPNSPAECPEVCDVERRGGKPLETSRYAVYARSSVRRGDSSNIRLLSRWRPCRSVIGLSLSGGAFTEFYVGGFEGKPKIFQLSHIPTYFECYQRNAAGAYIASPSSGYWYSTDVRHPGELRITKFDTSSLLISGSFSMLTSQKQLGTYEHPSEDTMTISGEFVDIPVAIDQ